MSLSSLCHRYVNTWSHIAYVQLHKVSTRDHKMAVYNRTRWSQTDSEQLHKVSTRDHKLVVYSRTRWSQTGSAQLHKVSTRDHKLAVYSRTRWSQTGSAQLHKVSTRDRQHWLYNDARCILELKLYFTTKRSVEFSRRLQAWLDQRVDRVTSRSADLDGEVDDIVTLSGTTQRYDVDVRSDKVADVVFVDATARLDEDVRKSLFDTLCRLVQSLSKQL